MITHSEKCNCAECIVKKWLEIYANLEAENKRLKTLCEAAKEALRSYQYGNSSTELAEGIADNIEHALKGTM